MYKNKILPILSLSLISFINGCAQPSLRSVEKADSTPLDQPQLLAAQRSGAAGANLVIVPLRCAPESEPENQWLTAVDTAVQFLPAASTYANIWDRIRSGYAIPEVDNKRVQRKIDWYKRHPRHLERVTERAQRYVYHVVESINKAGLPMELALLPIVESAYDPFAYSHGRAAGMWQFIASTGLHFGLQKNWWYDGRRDISASTDAALSYLYHLYQELDEDWLLALAAYNAGEGNVKRAIQRNRKAGRPTDFWNLNLPRETSAYVPKLLAVARLIKQPTLYNVKLANVPDAPYFESVDVGTQIDLAQAAKLAGIGKEELHLLNPGFNRWATAPEGPHQLLLPVANIGHFRSAMAKLDANARLPWHHYKIKRGDSLGKIAAQHGTTTNMLRNANNLQHDVIHADNTLLVPATRIADATATNTGQVDLEATFKFSRGASRTNYQVKPGDSLWKIGQQFHVSTRDLASWNRMTPDDSLHIGRHMTIWNKSPNLAATVNTNMVRKVGYRVRSGDSLYQIAQRFSINSDDIARWNALGKDAFLRPGQALTLYIDLRNAI